MIYYTFTCVNVCDACSMYLFIYIYVIYIKFKNNALWGAQIWWQQPWQTLRAQAMAVAMVLAICRAAWMEKTDGGKGNGNIGGKNTGKYVAGVKTRAANPMAKPGLRAKALGNTCGNERANLHCRHNGNACGKAMEKIVARAKDWTRKWEIIGKNKPRRHIAWPHDIVCARWLAQTASDIVPCIWQFSIRWLWCEMIKLRAQKLVCLQFTWSAIAFRLCFGQVVFCASAILERCAMLAGHRKSVEQHFAQAAAHLPPVKK